METRVGRWHSRATAYGDIERALPAARALERSRDELLQVLHDSLTHVFGEERTVYVLRSVDVGRVTVAAEGTAGQQAARIGRKLADGVARAILGDPGDGQNLMRFDDDAQFAAHFIHDLLGDRAWGRWYYGAFVRLRAATTAATIRAVLASHANELARLLGYLARLGALDRVLALIGSEASMQLVRAATSRDAPAITSSVRPLFDAAVVLAERFGWLIPAASTDALQGQFARLVAAGRIDWRDRRAITSTVVEALWQLIDAGLAHAQSAPALDQGLRADFDWLGWPELERALDAMTASKPAQPAAMLALPARRGATGTSRQLDMIAAVVAAIRASGVRFTAGPGEAGLRIMAALDQHDHRWSDNAAALELIEHVCILSCCAVRTGNFALLNDALDPSRPLPDLEGLEVDERLRVQRAAHALRRMHAARDDLVRAVASRLGRPFAAAASESIPTQCAGLFLLARALVDVRLPQVLARADYPTADRDQQLKLFLAALGSAWGGASDAGLAVWSGLDPRLWSDIESTWAAATDEVALQSEMLRLLVAQRVIEPIEMRVYCLKTATVAGDSSGLVYPLGVSSAVSADVLVERWRIATGCEPRVAIAEPSECERLAHVLQALQPQMTLPREAALTIALTATGLLRVWAKWLRRFASSGVEYVLEQMIRRAGTLHVSSREITVVMEEKGLDVVLEMAGYLAPTPKVPWLGDRVIRFRRGSP